jgi:CDP-paratose 2-epimerase
VGSEVVRWFSRAGWTVHGIDDNQLAIFFGPAGDTRWNQRQLEHDLRGFVHHEIDVRDQPAILVLIADLRPTSPR